MSREGRTTWPKVRPNFRLPHDHHRPKQVPDAEAEVGHVGPS
jgi:hypothetical protein